MEPAAGGTSFGFAQGREARLYALENERLKACITDYAGALVSLEAPDRDGRRDHVLLGFDDVTGYVDNRGSFGALLGRTANRIAGGRFAIGRDVYELSRNEGDNTLHGGAAGFGKRFWSVEEASSDRVRLALTSADGDQGFPGEVSVEATWRLDGPELSLGFVAKTTQPTPVSLSAHPYFNLDGLAAGDCLDHQVEIFADSLPPDRPAADPDRGNPAGGRNAVRPAEPAARRRPYPRAR